MVLRDLGAQVIKVEQPDGDEARGFGPFLPPAGAAAAAGPDGLEGAAAAEGASAYFTSLNCGKRSLVLDLKQATGREALAGLVRRADVLVENFRPGTLARLGFSAERLQQLNPRLVYAAISGFGATGPAAQRPAYDLIIQALSGLMSITGTEAAAGDDAADETDGGAAGSMGNARAAAAPLDPTGASGHCVRVGSSVADIFSGLYAALGIAAALVRRAATGAGAVLDLAMLDATVSVLENAIARYQVTGQIPRPLGSRHPSICPFETFATADREIVIAAGNNRLFAALCAALGRPELAADPRFLSNAARNRHTAALKCELEAALRRAPSAVWLRRLARARVPVAPVNTVADLFADPQIAAREMLLPVAGSDGFQVAGTPLKFADVAPERQRPPAPALGEHTAEVLREIAGGAGQGSDGH